MLKKKLSLALILPAVLVTACGGDSSEGPDPVFSLAVSDAPVNDLSSVVACFNQIQLKRSDSASGDLVFTVGEDNNTIAANDLCLDSNDDVIPNTVGINLFDYTGSDSITLLDGTTIDPGNYSQLRLVMSEGSYAIDATTDEKVKVVVPSNELKLDGFTATQGGVLDFTVEFDLRKGMTDPVGQDHYILKPRGVRLVDNSEAGHIEGTVSETLLSNNADEGCIVTPSDLTTNVATVYLYEGADLETASLSDNGGAETNQPLASTGVTYDGVQTYSFEIGFVNADSYTIALSCDTEDNPEADDEVNFIQAKNVTVIEGNTPSLVTFE